VKAITMFSLLVLLTLCAAHHSQSYLLRCDFETPCVDFASDRNWGLTDGLHPHPIDHDHTLNNSSGQYLFYNPQPGSAFFIAQIKTTDWIESPLDRAICFQMWYYTPQVSQPFSIQLVQGDDEQLTRVVSSIPGKDPSIDDWTLITVPLPAETIKIFVRLNVTNGSLAFDDLTVDYCDRPRPSPVQTMYACDIESSCIDDFVVPSEYPYLWSTIRASDAVAIDDQAPPFDYTFGNGSGHYAWVQNLKPVRPGKVGYFITRLVFNFTANATYCLNFEYYGYGRVYKSHLTVYTIMEDNRNTVQKLWPIQDPWQYSLVAEIERA
jgi:MAM domain, meprin/A5/mu